MLELLGRPAAELAALARRGVVSAREIAEARLRRIAEVQPRLNAVVDLDAARAVEAASALDEAQANGRPLGSLHGVPLTIKSSIDVAGLLCETGSRFRQGRRAASDAPLVARLRRAGAVILGVTNTPDLLMAYETDNFLYGRTNNPYDLERTAGGSSGGEAAAIASGCSAGGFGSDGGGSVRVPAHFCGLYGLKPTAGLIPRTGHWPACIGPGGLMGLIGPMAHSAQDLQLLLEAAAGPDDADPYAAPADVRAPAPDDLRRLRIGLLEEFPAAPVTNETRQAVRRAADALSERGFVVEPFTFPEGFVETARRHWWTFFGVVARTLIQPMTAGREEDLHPSSLGLLAAPEEVEAMTYSRFLETWLERDQLRAQLAEAFRSIDVLLCPVASVAAFRHGERAWEIDGRTVRYLDAFSYSQIFNLTGHPSVAAPAGGSPEGPPIGVQLVTKPFQDAWAIALAGELEAALAGPPGLIDFKQKFPGLL